jgi:DNA-directed RNA polymerase subunit N (RpoN/RPB10)
MIIPMVCWSCGKPIAHKWVAYCEMVKKYKNDGEQQPEFLALKDLQIGRECCRRMFLCQQDMYEKIK